ncbi:MAG: damage-inducible protein DinB, partial [Treponema sp.]|nr:damage-inducible protein DinB [Treponema sp.]
MVTFAKYNQEANKNILELLNKLSNDEREKERGSYYHSLSGLVR